MPWPKSTDYIEAVQNLRQSMGDEELRAGQLAETPLGLPMVWSGGFADVYKIHNAATGNTWALKCFTKKVDGQAERYQQISNHLAGARLPFMVDFTYLGDGIRVHGESYPALKMHWVEGGIRLNEFVEQYLNRPRTLSELLRIWVKMADRLRQAAVGHCDLQHGNVLMVPRDGGSLALRLIDYDGVHVPSLAGARSPELGHPAFQHPQRSRDRVYSAEVDRFSHLAIYTSIHCLTVGREELWKRFNNSDNLLFREGDFRNPGNSEVFRTLWKLPDAGSRALVGRLALACEKPLDQVPLLDEVADGEVYPLTQAEEQAVDSLFGSAPTSHPVAVAESTETAAASAMPEWMKPESNSADDPLREVSPKAAPKRHTPLRLLLAFLRVLDLPLKMTAGEENEILHNFLRVMASVVLVTLIVLGVKLMPQWVEAGGPYSGNEGSDIMLGASTSSDVSSYEWDLDGDGQYDDASGATVAFNSNDGVFTVGLLVTDNEGVAYTDVAEVIVRNVSPKADAGGPYRGSEGDVLTVDASTSFDPGQDIISYEWDLDGDGQYGDASGMTAAFTCATLGTHTIGVRVTDDTTSDTDTTTVIVERPRGYTNVIGMQFRLIPAGEFMMGSASAGEKSPQHRVRITKPFYMGAHEVTQEAYEKVMGKNPSQFKGPSLPVEQVHWADAALFCKKLSEMDRKYDYRLPTEAEWEYACRAGTTTLFSCGDDLDPACAWFRDNSGGKTHPVGEKRPNAWGLHDMHGNVREWCADFYHERYYQHSPPLDDPPGFRPFAPNHNSEYVIRGGSWDYGASNCLSAVRGGDSSVPRRTRQGFRVVSVPVESTALPETPMPPPEPETNTSPPPPPDATFDLPEDHTNAIGMQFKLIPAGEFMMGSPEDDSEKRDEEMPQHRVRITKPFYLGIHEVTQEQYEKVMDKNRSELKGSSLPVNWVSWVDATAFCEKLSEMDAENHYRLPTEAEWEYACRAGTTTRYSCGSELGSDYVWFNERSSNKPHPVGEKRPNAWGLYDMHGNVCEWCSDWYDDYRVSPSADPTGPSTGRARVSRGGSWRDPARGCRSAFRSRGGPGDMMGDRGFRVALVPAEPLVPPVAVVPTKAPFNDFPKAVAIPILSDNDSAGEASKTPMTLAHVRGPVTVDWHLLLVGGDKVFKGGRKFVLTRTEIDPAKASWSIELEDETDAAKEMIARIWRRGENLRFQWDDRASEASANYFRNCFLQVRIAGESRYLSLTKTIQAEPVVLDLLRGQGNAKIAIKWAPNNDLIRFKFSVSGTEKVRFDPAEPVEAKTQVSMAFVYTDRYQDENNAVTYQIRPKARKTSLAVDVRLVNPTAQSFKALLGNSTDQQIGVAIDQLGRRSKDIERKMVDQTGEEAQKSNRELDQLAMQTWVLEFFLQAHKKATLDYEVIADVGGQELVLASSK